MSYTINLRKYQKLLKEVNYLRSELDYQEEVLRVAHLDFESYYREWCANNDIDLDGRQRSPDHHGKYRYQEKSE